MISSTKFLFISVKENYNTYMYMENYTYMYMNDLFQCKLWLHAI